MSSPHHHLPHVTVLLDRLTQYFSRSYSVEILEFDPLMILPSYNEPGINHSYWDFVTSFLRSPLVRLDKPFPTGAIMWAYLCFLVVYRKFPHRLDTDNLSNVIDLPWFKCMCREYCNLSDKCRVLIRELSFIFS